MQVSSTSKFNPVHLIPLAMSVLLLVTAGCSSPGSLQTIDAPTVEALDADRLREINFAYWEALNAYDPERVLAFLEDNYRAKVGDSIRTDIERMRSFGVTLGASEETPPQLISPGHARMYVLIKDPMGTRRVQMDFLQIDDGWKISFAEEVD